MISLSLVASPSPILWSYLRKLLNFASMIMISLSLVASLRG